MIRKASHGRLLSVFLLAAVGIAGCSDGGRASLDEAAGGAELCCATWNPISNGGPMKRIKLAEGISVAIPSNFPRPVESEDGAAKTISYSLRPHEGAPRFLHFFEIRLSREAPSPDQLLDSLGCEIGDTETEEIIVGGRKTTLRATSITITLPCGSQEHATFYSWTCYCAEREMHVLIATFTMTREGFLDIVKSFRCS